MTGSAFIIPLNGGTFTPQTNVTNGGMPAGNAIAIIPLDANSFQQLLQLQQQQSGQQPITNLEELLKALPPQLGQQARAENLSASEIMALIALYIAMLQKQQQQASYGGQSPVSAPSSGTDGGNFTPDFSRMAAASPTHGRHYASSPTSSRTQPESSYSSPTSPTTVGPVTPFAATGPVDMNGIFSGGTNSIIARIVGAAEGTRTKDGGFTSAFNEHTDPGNGKRNQGSFSYQHGAANANEADQKQIARIQREFMPGYVAAARNAGLNPNDPRLLFGAIDLFNQSPRAARDFLKQMPQIAARGLSKESIIQARVDSFRREDGSIDASGFGHSESRLTADQTRRVNAMDEAMRTQNIGVA